MDDTTGSTGFPAAPTPADEVLADLEALHGEDIDWRGGRSFSLVYNPDDDGLEALLDRVGVLYLHENGLNPFKYPSLIRVESDVVAWAASLFGTDPKAGTLTSGGTESIFLAVHTAREHHRRRTGGEGPSTIVTANTVHPAFAKACHYLGLEHVRVDVGADLRADPEAMLAACDDRTALVVVSAPCYPYGVIDPIGVIAPAAAERDIPCHVDACLGGWLLPFWERLGEPVAPWDFRVPGVTSLSADVHKYGYAFKGASTILYRDPSWVQYQWFVYDDWPGGLYGSTTTAGTRPAAPMVGAWAAIRHLGEAGYLHKAQQVRDATRGFLEGIASIDALEVHGEPDMSVFEFGSSQVDIGAVGDHLDDLGWNLDRQHGGLHAMMFPYHLKVVDRFCADLAEAVAAGGTSRGAAAGYGGIVA